MSEVTAEEKLLREWVNRYWNRPEMGAWVCCKCIQMDARWSDTVAAIRNVNPNNPVVRYWDESNGRHVSGAKNNVEKERLGGVPDGLTHRAVWNASARHQCWVCQGVHSSWGSARGIAYTCYRCNPEGDLRAAMTSAVAIERTICPHCMTRQSADQTRWWHNPPLESYNPDSQAEGQPGREYWARHSKGRLRKRLAPPAVEDRFTMDERDHRPAGECSHGTCEEERHHRAPW